MSTARRVIATARAEVGYREGRTSGHWNNVQRYSPAVPGLQWSQGQAWCSTFVSWVFRTAGAAGLAPVTASCAAGVEWYRVRGRFSDYPVIGGPVYFGPGGGTHVGLCVAYTDTTITTVEGNTNANGSAEGDGVYEKTRPRRSAYVHGYGVPDYPEGVVLADPAWRSRRGVTFFAHAASVADLPSATDSPSAARATNVEAFAPFPGADWFRRSPRSPLVTAMGRRLVAEGCAAYADGPDPQWTEADRRGYAAWQRKLGYTGADADGWPGRASWDALKVPPA
ncbi:peptidoglycan-binding protein [Streptomyces sp. NPDC003077]|uniref:peptidoglycan-binding protein n=1 Tax=Streptomyces sp. NPDC003077 TaxID=3154443 RepID=UPI0033B21FEF